VITNRELSIYLLPHPQLAVKELFKSKISRVDSECGRRETGETYFSPVVMTLMEQTYASTTKLSGVVDQMAGHSASGLRIRKGLGV
jgi:hypothetical protein